MQPWIAIAGFGLIGIFSRYGLDSLAIAHGLSRPLFTLGINIFGSFLAGALAGFSPNGLDQPWKVGLLVGFCGGFTTFSGFSLQLLEFAQKGEANMAMALGLASPILCFLSVVVGFYLSRQMVSF